MNETVFQRFWCLGTCKNKVHISHKACKAKKAPQNRSNYMAWQFD